MNLLEMTRGGNSKYSQLSTAIDPSTTVIPVQDISYFASAPNYATIGVDNDAEVIYYTGIDITNSALTGCVREQSETVPNVWPVSTYVYNAITSTLINNMEDNITTLSEVIGNSGLLINSNFSVWQRAESAVAPATANYVCVDRWRVKAVSGTPTIARLSATSGLKCTGGSAQITYTMDVYDLAIVSGKTCTLSYKLNGVIKTQQLTPSGATVVSLNLANGDQLEWVKLELGEQATEYVQPTYVETYLQCCRYCFLSHSYIPGMTSGTANSSVFSISHDLMRTEPIVVSLEPLGYGSVFTPSYSNFTAKSFQVIENYKKNTVIEILLENSVATQSAVLLRNRFLFDAEI